MNAPSPIRRPVRHFARTFLAGLLAALPLVATVGVFAWLAQLLYGWLGPQSLIGGVFVRVGLGGFGSAGAPPPPGAGWSGRNGRPAGPAWSTSCSGASRWCATSTTSSTASSTCWGSATKRG